MVPAKGTLFFEVYLLCILWPVQLFQMWPFHKIPNVPRGIIFNVPTAVAGALITWLIWVLVDANPMTIAKVVTWGFCLFIGMYLFMYCFQAAHAPPVPGTAGLPAAGPESPETSKQD
jgi:hypothetical protein